MKKFKRIICIILAALIIVTAPVTSYMQVEAAEWLVTLGSVAVGDILADLLLSVGVTSLGCASIYEMKKNGDCLGGLDAEIRKHGSIEAAIKDVQAYKDNNAGQAVTDVNYTSSTGYKLAYAAGKLTVTLSPSLIKAAKDAAREWADSKANEITVAEGEAVSGTESVSSEYMNSITTTINTIPSVKSMSDIDSFFSIDGAYDYLTSMGYSDSGYYFLINVVGSKTYVMPVPIGYSVLAYRLSWLGSSGLCILSNGSLSNAINQNGVRDASSFSSYFNSLSKYKGKYYTYDHSSDSWSVTSDNYLPSYDVLTGKKTISNWYTCNYQNAFTKGASISYTYFCSDMTRLLYTYKTVVKNLVYDLSIAPSIPADGYTFAIPEADYAGFDYTDFAAFLDYITSLCEQLEQWHEESVENQEEIIQQNKNILSALNSLQSLINTISINVGKSTTAVLSIEKAIDDLPKDIAAEIGGAISIPGMDTLTDAVNALPGAIADEFNDVLVGVLPGIITDSVTDALPYLPDLVDDVDAIADALKGGIAVDMPDIVIPDIVIPDIVIPDIVIPEIKVPDVNVSLDPTYEITVTNDYTGLDAIIAGAVAGVLTDLFVPDQVATMAKLGAIQAYFQFKDDIIGAFDDLKTMIFGITPSPILKIPIGAETSKYNYGLGSYIIIDISWYAPYKQFGDKIILAICWALFIWRLYIKLPGIISGTEGSIVAADKAYDRYTRTNSKKGD